MTSRVMKMAETHLDAGATPEAIVDLDTSFSKALDAFDFNKAVDIVWAWIGEVDEQITNEEPFKVVKVDKQKAQEMIVKYVKQLSKVAKHLEPIMPSTAEIIQKAISKNKKPENLFERV